ncbi:MAG: DUF1700 domain-containing protein [Oscillospiraceae bacterium]|jgi:anti-sigma-K factor RskA|nr:DUF1700 domain-containing protein [Oscillospiraceae bacterium]
MKEQYLRQTAKALHLPRKAKQEILRDLAEIFDSALEHGETEAQVVKRLGNPAEFADDAAKQLGFDNHASAKRRHIFAIALSLIVAAIAFGIYAAARMNKAPKGVIGQADAMTHILVVGSIDVSGVLLVIGLLAAAAAVLLLIHKNRKP